MRWLREWLLMVMDEVTIIFMWIALLAAAVYAILKMR